MPKYYFNFHRPDARALLDEEGLELENAAEAKRKALQTLPDLLAESLTEEIMPIQVSIEIVQEGGDLVQIVKAQIDVAQQQ